METVQRPPLGNAVPRKETSRFVAGKGTYVDDILLPGTLYAAFVRSPYAHARIQTINSDAALSMPGVRAVFTGRDLVGKLRPLKAGGSPIVREVQYYPLALHKTKYFGEPVAAVIADSRYLAEDAIETIAVDYDPLPAVVDAEQALASGATRVHDELKSNMVLEYHFSTAGIEQIFEKADRVFSERIRSQRLSACPIEPRAYLADWNSESGQLTFWSTTANPHGLKSRLADFLGLHENNVRVIAPDVGGSFGAKVVTYQEEFLLPYLSMRLGRPVKWCETRVEHLRNARHGRDQIHYIQLAVKTDGTVLAIKDKIIGDLGASYSVDPSMMASTLYIPAVYDVQNYAVDSYGVATNKTTHGPVRGIGKADASYVIERMMDIVARGLGMDPVDIRQKNLIPAEAFPYRSVTGALYDSGQYHLCLNRTVEAAGYQELRQEQKRLRDEGVYRGIGVAFVMEPTSSSRIQDPRGYASCRVRIEPSGAMNVFSSMGEQGQGHETTLAQIVASHLGTSAEKVHVIHGDTSLTPYGFGTASSRSSVVLMPAAWIAGAKVREKVLAIASRKLKIPPQELELQEGKIYVRENPDRNIELAEIVRVAYRAIHQLPENMEPELEATGYFVSPNIDYEPDELGRMNTFSSYPYAAVVAVVDVDVETGFVKIVKYFTVHDCGNMINPRIVETQHYGSIIQGLGATFYEELRYDDEGRLLTSTFMDYSLPSVAEVPDIHLGHLVTPNPFTPLGAKGAGETGMLGPPPALSSAIEDALSPLGVKLRDTPLTPEKILHLIACAKEEEASNGS
ncbi:MAG: xanthine dehydrogenase family protein molybdopterin-binding subunit [Deltaproteobacteria bacterium]|nr:xanthine dehydrogenase family protein molybdopterin-binding subunit [Deltaproteobacteria bacterium]